MVHPNFGQTNFVGFHFGWPHIFHSSNYLVLSLQSTPCVLVLCPRALEFVETHM
jgi:hypothetical protein